MKRLLGFAVALLLSTNAFAQPVQQSGPITPNTAAIWSGTGIIKGGNTATDSPLTTFGVTRDAADAICVSSARSTAAGRNQLCFQAATSGPARISLNNFGTAAPQSLNFVINGITYPFPGSLSQLTIGVTPVVGGFEGTCLFVSGGLVGNQTCAASSISSLTGDVTAAGPGAAAATLATVNGNVGTFGSTTVVPLVTVNGKGLITSITNATIAISANTQLNGTTLAGSVVSSSLTSLGTIGTGIWQGTLISPTFGGTGINNGSNTLTLAASLATTGTGSPTLAFPATNPFTYTFQNSSDTIVGRATTDTLINKTLTTPTINGAALSGTLSGTPAFSGANFVTYANIVVPGAATIVGNPTATAGSNQTAFTINGLVDITTPSSTLDFIPIFNHTTGTIQRTTANELITAAGGGVTSIAGNAGAFTLSTGITNSVNDIRLVVPVTAPNGGTGVVSPTAHTIPINAGASAQLNTGVGTLGQALVSGGVGVDPSYKSGAHVLLNTLTVSSSANLQDTTSITASYNEYEIVFENLVTSTSNSSLILLAHSGGTFQTTTYVNTTGTVANGAFAGTAADVTSVEVGAFSQATAVPGLSGTIRVYAPALAAAPKHWSGLVAFNNNSSGLTSVFVSGLWNGGNGAVDGFEVCFSTTSPTCTGNITSGVVKIYGIL
jgi:hypothetical protein